MPTAQDLTNLLSSPYFGKMLDGTPGGEFFMQLPGGRFAKIRKRTDGAGAGIGKERGYEIEVSADLMAVIAAAKDRFVSMSHMTEAEFNTWLSEESNKVLKKNIESAIISAATKVGADVTGINVAALIDTDNIISILCDNAIAYAWAIADDQANDEEYVTRFFASIWPSIKKIMPDLDDGALSGFKRGLTDLRGVRRAAIIATDPAADATFKAKVKALLSNFAIDLSVNLSAVIEIGLRSNSEFNKLEPEQQEQILQATTSRDVSNMAAIAIGAATQKMIEAGYSQKYIVKIAAPTFYTAKTLGTNVGDIVRHDAEFIGRNSDGTLMYESRGKTVGAQEQIIKKEGLIDGIQILVAITNDISREIETDKRKEEILNKAYAPIRLLQSLDVLNKDVSGGGDEDVAGANATKIYNKVLALYQSSFSVLKVVLGEGEEEDHYFICKPDYVHTDGIEPDPQQVLFSFDSEFKITEGAAFDLDLLQRVSQDFGSKIEVLTDNGGKELLEGVVGNTGVDPKAIKLAIRQESAVADFNQMVGVTSKLLEAKFNKIIRLQAKEGGIKKSNFRDQVTQAVVQSTRSAILDDIHIREGLRYIISKAVEQGGFEGFYSKIRADRGFLAQVFNEFKQTELGKALFTNVYGQPILVNTQGKFLELVNDILAEFGKEKGIEPNKAFSIIKKGMFEETLPTERVLPFSSAALKADNTADPAEVRLAVAKVAINAEASDGRPGVALVADDGIIDLKAVKSIIDNAVYPSVLVLADPVNMRTKLTELQGALDGLRRIEGLNIPHFETLFAKFNEVYGGLPLDAFRLATAFDVAQGVMKMINYSATSKRASLDCSKKMLLDIQGMKNDGKSVREIAVAIHEMAEGAIAESNAAERKDNILFHGAKAAAEIANAIDAAVRSGGRVDVEDIARRFISRHEDEFNQFNNLAIVNFRTALQNTVQSDIRKVSEAAIEGVMIGVARQIADKVKSAVKTDLQNNFKSALEGLGLAGEAFNNAYQALEDAMTSLEASPADPALTAARDQAQVDCDAAEARANQAKNNVDALELRINNAKNKAAERLCKKNKITLKPGDDPEEKLRDFVAASACESAAAFCPEMRENFDEIIALRSISAEQIAERVGNVDDRADEEGQLEGANLCTTIQKIFTEDDVGKRIERANRSINGINYLELKSATNPKKRAELAAFIASNVLFGLDLPYQHRVGISIEVFRSITREINNFETISLTASSLATNLIKNSAPPLSVGEREEVIHELHKIALNIARENHATTSKHDKIILVQNMLKASTHGLAIGSREYFDVTSEVLNSIIQGNPADLQSIIASCIAFSSDMARSISSVDFNGDDLAKLEQATKPAGMFHAKANFELQNFDNPRFFASIAAAHVALAHKKGNVLSALINFKDSIKEIVENLNFSEDKKVTALSVMLISALETAAQYGEINETTLRDLANGLRSILPATILEIVDSRCDRILEILEGSPLLNEARKFLIESRQQGVLRDTRRPVVARGSAPVVGVESSGAKLWNRQYFNAFGSSIKFSDEEKALIIEEFKTANLAVLSSKDRLGILMSFADNLGGLDGLIAGGHGKKVGELFYGLSKEEITEIPVGFRGRVLAFDFNEGENDKAALTAMNCVLETMLSARGELDVDFVFNAINGTGLSMYVVNAAMLMLKPLQRARLLNTRLGENIFEYHPRLIPGFIDGFSRDNADNLLAVLKELSPEQKLAILQDEAAANAVIDILMAKNPEMVAVLINGVGVRIANVPDAIVTKILVNQQVSTAAIMQLRGDLDCIPSFIENVNAGIVADAFLLAFGEDGNLVRDILQNANAGGVIVTAFITATNDSAEYDYTVVLFSNLTGAELNSVSADVIGAINADKNARNSVLAKIFEGGDVDKMMIIIRKLGNPNAAQALGSYFESLWGADDGTRKADAILETDVGQVVIDAILAATSTRVGVDLAPIIGLINVISENRYERVVVNILQLPSEVRTKLLANDNIRVVISSVFENIGGTRVVAELYANINSNDDNDNAKIADDFLALSSDQRAAILADKHAGPAVVAIAMKVDVVNGNRDKVEGLFDNILPDQIAEMHPDTIRGLAKEADKTTLSNLIISVVNHDIQGYSRGRVASDQEFPSTRLLIGKIRGLRMGVPFAAADGVVGILSALPADKRMGFLTQGNMTATALNFFISASDNRNNILTGFSVDYIAAIDYEIRLSILSRNVSASRVFEQLDAEKLMAFFSGYGAAMGVIADQIAQIDKAERINILQDRAKIADIFSKKGTHEGIVAKIFEGLVSRLSQDELKALPAESKCLILGSGAMCDEVETLKQQANAVIQAGVAGFAARRRKAAARAAAFNVPQFITGLTTANNVDGIAALINGQMAAHRQEVIDTIAAMEPSQKASILGIIAANAVSFGQFKDAVSPAPAPAAAGAPRDFASSIDVVTALIDRLGGIGTRSDAAVEAAGVGAGTQRRFIKGIDAALAVIAADRDLNAVVAPDNPNGLVKSLATSIMTRKFEALGIDVANIAVGFELARKLVSDRLGVDGNAVADGAAGVGFDRNNVQQMLTLINSQKLQVDGGVIPDGMDVDQVKAVAMAIAISKCNVDDRNAAVTAIDAVAGAAAPAPAWVDSAKLLTDRLFRGGAARSTNPFDALFYNKLRGAVQPAGAVRPRGDAATIEVKPLVTTAALVV